MDRVSLVIIRLVVLTIVAVTVVFVILNSRDDTLHDGPIYYKRLGGDSLEIDDSHSIHDENFVVHSTVMLNDTIFRVVSVGNSAFSSEHFTTLTIEEGITRIGDDAFARCHQLLSVKLPESLTTIGDDAFCDCDNITEPVCNSHIFAYLPTSFAGVYDIPEGITYIAGGAFADCHCLTGVTFPESLESAGYMPFGDCKWTDQPLYSNKVFMHLPDSFAGCYQIPEGITYIAGGSFAMCKELTEVRIPESVTDVGDRLFTLSGVCEPIIINDIFVYMPEDYKGVYVVPEGITKIAGGAFRYCDSLTDVILPEGLLTIGQGAFSLCDSLTIVTLPRSVVFVGAGAFAWCSNLRKVIVQGEETHIEEDINNERVRFVRPVAKNKELPHPKRTVNIAVFCIVGLIIITVLSILMWRFRTRKRNCSIQRDESGKPKDKTGKGPGLFASMRLFDILYQNEFGRRFSYPVTGLISLLVKYYKSLSHAIRHIADYKGRSTRSELMWLLQSVLVIDLVAYMVASIVVRTYDIHIRIFTLPLPLFVMAVVALLMLVPITACAVRRCHDAAKSGWWLLCPIYNIVILFSPSVLRSGVNADGSRVLIVLGGCVVGDQLDECVQHGPTCAVKAQQIVLNEFGIKVSEQECVAYATSRGWYDNGTPVEHVGKLLERHGLPVRRFSQATINDLVAELTRGHLVIACVDFSELYMNRWLRKQEEIIQPNHVVIVNGIDITDSDNKVAYITDSAVGVRNYACPLDNFLDAWQDSEGDMLATRKPVPGWRWGKVKPYEFNLDEYPYSLVRHNHSDCKKKR